MDEADRMFVEAEESGDEEELNELKTVLYLSLACKHSSWKHEREYRALVPAVKGKYFDLEPHRIYVGMNCAEDHENAWLKSHSHFADVGYTKCNRQIMDECLSW